MADASTVAAPGRWLRLIGPAASLRRELVHGGIGSLAVRGAMTVTGAALAVTLARALGPADYGVYSFSLAVVTILAIPATMGMPTLVVRETARAEAAGDWARLIGLWRWATIAVALTSALAALAVVAFAWLTPGEWTSAKGTTLLIGAALIPLSALGGLRGAALQGLRRIVLGQLPDTVIRPALLLAFAAAAILLPGRRLTPQLTMGLHALAAALAFAFGAAVLLRCRPAGVHGATPHTDARAWLAALAPLALIGGVQVLIQQTSVVILGLLDTDAEVGVFRVAAQSAALVAFGLQAVSTVAMPHAARLSAPDERARLQKLATASARTSFAFAFAAFLGAVILGGFLLATVFGRAYAAGTNALAIMAAGQLVYAAFGPAAVFLNMAGHERLTLAAAVGAALAGVALNLALIPSLGLNGAALAAAITLALWNALLWWFARRQIGVDTLVAHL